MHLWVEAGIGIERDAATGIVRFLAVVDTVNWFTSIRTVSPFDITLVSARGHLEQLRHHYVTLPSQSLGRSKSNELLDVALSRLSRETSRELEFRKLGPIALQFGVVLHILRLYHYAHRGSWRRASVVWLVTLS